MELPPPGGAQAGGGDGPDGPRSSTGNPRTRVGSPSERLCHVETDVHL